MECAEKNWLRCGCIPVHAHNMGSCNWPGKVMVVGTLLWLAKSTEISVDCCVCGSW